MPITEIFAYEFMQNAFIAGTLAAILAGAVGYFVALRNLAFAGHALTHVGFAGAAGAGLISLTPMMGQLMITVLAAIGMGFYGDRVARDNQSIGIILAFALGLGSLFLYFYGSYAGQVTAILFGDLLGVSCSALQMMGLLTVLSLLALSVMSRPLLFSSLEPELAAAKGVNMTGLSIAFLSLMAITVTLASQVVGVLLVFTLLMGPATIAIRWTSQFWSGITVSILLAVLIVWLSIFLSYWTD
ncbi:MAG: metal ABC transporter permease, partial [Gammaproteobacteria bacterium]